MSWLAPGTWSWDVARIGLLGGAIACAATFVLARAARAIGFGDAAESARKLQSGPVPPIGGWALLLPWLLLLAPASLQEFSPLVLTPLLLLVAGTFDDLFGLRPLPKVATQLAAVSPLVASGDPFLALLVLVAINVANTFDNADGALATTSWLGFAAWGSPFCLWIAGFLPWNLNGGGSGGRTRPTAYLGDAGAYLLGAVLVLHPLTAFALWIPALDLARLSVLRWRRGSRPWIGDRRHLAHRLQAKGLRPPAVAGTLALAGAPAAILPVVDFGRALLLARSPGPVEWPGPVSVAGLALSTLAFAALLVWAPDPERAP